MDFVLLKLIFGFYLMTDPQVCWKIFVLSMIFYLDFENKLFVIFNERPFGVVFEGAAHFKFMRDLDDLSLFYDPNTPFSPLLYYFIYLPSTLKDFELWLFSLFNCWFSIFCIFFSDKIGLLFCFLSYLANNTSHYLIKILILYSLCEIRHFSNKSKNSIYNFSFVLFFNLPIFFSDYLLESSNNIYW